jgi:hypothetical protein
MITDPIVSIDPGKTCTGVAYLHGPLVWSTTIRGTTALDVDKVFKLLVSGDITERLASAKPRASDKVTPDESDALVLGRWVQLYGKVPSGHVRGKPILATEMQHLTQHGPPGQPRKINWTSIVTLIESRCYWTTLAIAYDVALVEVGASEWQGPMLGTTRRLDDKGEKRSTKDRSKEVTATVWRSVPRMMLIDRRATKCLASS